MPPLDDYAIRPQDIQQGAVALQKRQQKLQFWAVTSTAFLMVTGLSYFFQQDLVYSFFGLSSQIEYLHLPVSLDAALTEFASPPDYFYNLLAWFGWLFLKILVSFIGAFFVVKFLKKFRYFAKRFQSFVLKFVAWLIAFIVLWSGLSLWQHEIHHQEDDRTHRLVNYDRSIYDSEIAQYLKENSVPQPVQSYVLAQTALLQSPVDFAAAKPFVAQLIQAEAQDSAFEQYGFKAEQLWTLEQQVYGQAMTPIAKKVNTQAEQASQVTDLLQWGVIILGIALIILSGVLWMLAHFMKTKLNRIDQRLKI